MCHRAVEVEVAPQQSIPLVDKFGTPRFLAILRGSALLCQRSPSECVGLPSRVPIHRLRPVSHYGAMNIVLNRAADNLELNNLELHAGGEGCTLLVWNSDKFLQRELSKLPDLLSESWAAHSPLAMAP